MLVNANADCKHDVFVTQSIIEIYIMEETNA